MLVTKRPIEYRSAVPYGTICTIPQGTSVIPAVFSQGRDMFWAEPWEGMDEQTESWFRNFGFLINSDDVEELNA